MVIGVMSSNMGDKIKGFFITWLVLLVINQVVLFHACFAPYCLLAGLPHTGIIAFFLARFAYKEPDAPEIPKDVPKSQSRPSERRHGSVIDDFKTQTKSTQTKKAAQEKDPLKEKGDQYERYIGQQFEDKGALVIYNGFIKGYEDQGVDIISISTKPKEINLVQCKNWMVMRMSLEHVKDIYAKLERYDFDCFQLKSYEIAEHTKYPDTHKTMQSVKQDLKSFTIRKTLYVASDKVIELEIGPYLTMMSPTIFRYKDMKIVMKESG
jgi:hypothetical protein